MKREKSAVKQKHSETKKVVPSRVKASRRPSVVSGIQSRTLPPKGFDKGLHFFVTIILRVFSYFVVFFLGIAVAAIAIVILCSLVFLRIVSANSGIPSSRLVQIVHQSTEQSIEEKRINLLVLGTDALANRDEQSQLTDTIMIVSIHPSTGVISTFSLPRDLWIASQSAKMNALYQKDTSLPEKVIPAITGVTIDRKIVIDIATVGKMIDALGGLDVTVERSFVDYRFPRTDVDVRTEHNPNNLYETVAFTKGVEHMSGDRALRYIRSRHSPDPVEGTDDARVRRQQQVISALLQKLQDRMLIRNPEQIGALLALFEHDIHSDLTLQEAGKVAWQFIENKKSPHLVTHQFTVREVDKNGQITHPEKFPGGAWVYLPVDPTYAQMRNTVQIWLQD